MEVTQFNRSEMILGRDSTEKLSNKKVIIFGLGGVGSYVAEAIARAGVGYITIVDNDIVSETNINRQLCALHSTVGLNKTDVIAKRIADINPACKVTPINRFYSAENSDDFNLTDYDYIADAIDSVSSKLHLAELAYENNIKIISCMGTGNKLDPTLFRVSDISKTENCPLCRVMRYELKKRNIKHLTVVWSPETPLKPLESNEEISKRAVPGSVPFVPGVAGLIMAGKIITDLNKD